MTARPPFVGRDAELARVLRTLHERRGVVLLGAPGVGKTRLAAEVADRLRRSGKEVRDCYATVAAKAVPFGALALLVRADLKSGNPLREAVEDIPSGLVLKVDDAHLLDQASIALLQHLRRHRDTTLLLTARTMPWEDGELVRVEIGNLTRAESDQLVGDQGDQARLWARTRGNPLYLTELLKAGELTPKLAEVVEANLGTHRRALELLSYGEPLELDVFAELTSPEIVDQLEVDGLISVQETSVRLGHPLYGEVLRDNCPVLRSRSHRKRLAEALRNDVLRSAIWLLDSGSDVSVEQLAAAATRAWEARDGELTERLCRAAVECGGAVQVGPVLGSALLYGRAAEEADQVLEEIMRNATDAAARAELRTTRAFNLFFGLGDREKAEALLDDQPGLPDDLRWRMRLVRLLFDAQCEPVEITRKHLAEFEAAPGIPVWAALTARFVHVLCDLQGGRILDGLGTLDELAEQIPAVRSATSSIDDGYVRMRSLCLLHSGALAEAEEYARSVRAELENDPRNLFAEVSITSVLSRCAQLRGHAREALALAEQATSFPGHRPIVSDLLALCELVRSAALLGRADMARDALRRAEAAVRKAWPISGLQVDLARPWALAAAGALEEAMTTALATAEVARSYDASGVEAAALHDAARFGADTSVRLAELASELGDPLTAAYSTHALGRTSGDTTVLDDACARFSEIGATLFAAEALAERVRIDGNGARLAVLLDAFDGVELHTLRVPLHGRLTPRQLEVARLAATGMTSRQIAERMHTSKRTVDNHLYAAYAALGISGRAELRAALSV